MKMEIRKYDFVTATGERVEGEVRLTATRAVFEGWVTYPKKGSSSRFELAYRRENMPQDNDALWTIVEYEQRKNREMMCDN
jgi:hypothetical protein